jgi:predicted membrane channel-forming protein YqfA (hemolysin III family)
MNDEILSRKLADGGPFYRETDLTQWIAEPWNAVSSMAFIIVAYLFFRKVRANPSGQTFLIMAAPVMLIGGIGGTLYHAFRVSPVFLAMDVAPIYILAFGVSLWLWRRLLGSWALPIAIVAAFLILDSVIFYASGWKENIMQSAAYANMGAAMIVPLVAVLIKDQFDEGKWAVFALLAYAVGLTFRVLDAAEPPITPVGTHFLWHLCCATGTFMLGQYIFKLTGKIPSVMK